jgi:hypothetical protein
MIPITWPFIVWGLDLLGPFKKAPGGLIHLLIVVDTFTKWIEAKPLAKIGSMQAVDFIQDIIFHFGSLSLSLPTMALSSPEKNSLISVMTITSTWIGPQSPTRVQTGRSSTLMP